MQHPESGGYDWPIVSLLHRSGTLLFGVYDDVEGRKLDVPVEYTDVERLKGAYVKPLPDERRCSYQRVFF